MVCGCCAQQPTTSGDTINEVSHYDNNKTNRRRCTSTKKLSPTRSFCLSVRPSLTTYPVLFCRSGVMADCESGCLLTNKCTCAKLAPTCVVRVLSLMYRLFVCVMHQFQLVLCANITLSHVDFSVCLMADNSLLYVQYSVPLMCNV